jgi:Flp pilus assembly protein TadG
MNSLVVSMRNHTGSTMRREDGQTLLMFVLFMVVLFAFVGLAVDLGFAYITRAKLSKGVDAAALAGMRSIGLGTAQAGLIASNAFAANYGTSGRDVAPPALTIAFSKVNGNSVLDVNASVSINTFFIRVLPVIGGSNWKTLTVGDAAESTRSTLIMSLVLDRSGSMNNNGGAQALPPAVTNFIAQFDDTTDYASQISFSPSASVDVPMTQPFIAKIQSAALALTFTTDTCSDEGLTNGMVQIATETNVVAQSVIRVMIFFTDGMANSFNYVLNCGPRDIGYNGPILFDPVTGNINNTGCTVPATLSSIDPTTGAITANAVDASGSSQASCIAMHYEAQNRAERIAWLARSQGYVIYCIGMGNPCGNCGECNNFFPVLNPVFLENLANTTDSQTYDPTQPVGDFAIATSSAQLSEVFQTVASKILLRLSR